MIEFYPVFTIAPDFSTPPVFTFTDGRRDLELGATQRYGIYDSRGRRSMNAKWTLTNGADERILREFLLKNQGIANPFYIPSWTQDFIIANAAPAGAVALNIIVGVDYAVDLDPTKLDKFGTVAWFYSRDRELHVSRVISASSAGGSTTDIVLETKTPFAIDEGTYAGFCIFAKQVNDETQIVYKAPNSCEFELQVEEALHTLPNQSEQLISGQAINSYPPVVKTRQTPLPIGEKLSFTTAEIVGPEAYSLQQTFPHQRDWELEIVDGSGVQLKQSGGDIFFSDLYDAAPEGEHVHGLFDLSSKEHIAIGLTNGNIEVKFRDGTLAKRVATFEGFSPIMVNTWAVDASITAGQADMCVVYLKRGEAKLYIRFFGGFYSQEYLLCNSPVNPLYLTGVEVISGELLIKGLDVTHNLTTWVGEVTPIPPRIGDRFLWRKSTISGSYTPSLIPTNANDEAFLTFKDATISGSYNPTLIPTNANDEAFLTFKDATISGSYNPTLFAALGDDPSALQFPQTTTEGTYFFASPPTPRYLCEANLKLKKSTFAGTYQEQP